MKLLLSVLAFASFLAAQQPRQAFRSVQQSAKAAVLTGAHWANASDLAALKNQVGLDFAIVNVNENLGNPATLLQGYLAAAQAAGLRLIIGYWPPPFTLNADGATWTISANGQTFLRTLAANPSQIMGVFGFNEPYWTNPTTATVNGIPPGGTSMCGVLSAAQLRSLRTAIRSYYPGAKIYHDFGDPNVIGWGASTGCTPSVASKYQDQSNVADYAGIWYYPFSSNGYQKAAGLSFAAWTIPFVNSMGGVLPVFLMQSFACPGCASDGAAAVIPSPANAQDWNCSIRPLLPVGGLMSEYVWDLQYSPDNLKPHTELWPVITAKACAPPAPTVTVTDPSGKSGVYALPVTIK